MNVYVEVKLKCFCSVNTQSVLETGLLHWPRRVGARQRFFKAGQPAYLVVCLSNTHLPGQATVALYEGTGDRAWFLRLELQALY